MRRSKSKWDSKVRLSNVHYCTYIECSETGDNVHWKVMRKERNSKESGSGSGGGRYESEVRTTNEHTNGLSKTRDNKRNLIIGENDNPDDGWNSTLSSVYYTCACSWWMV